MPRKFFGTDGIRGVSNKGSVTADVMMKAGQAAGIKFTRGSHQHRVIIGKDTRLSGYMIENALTAGFLSVGMDVILAGPVPTPAVAMLTRSMRADLGVMISASHNLFQDNGIKLFGPDGYKLSDQIEKEIEELMQGDMTPFLVEPHHIGKAKRIDDVSGRYIEFIKNTFPKGMTLDGMKIVIDCANGAAYKIGPTVLWELGAEVIALGNNPNGFNINAECGSTNPEALCKAVLENKADIGIALDGDADRLIVVDKEGKVIDGDQLIAMIAQFWSDKKMLKGNGVVTTKMSNLGLEKYLKTMNLDLKRTDIGDRYVLEYMKKHGFNVGGEQSGHIILSDYSTTGDGMVAALQILAVMVEKGGKSELFRAFEPLPQVLVNIRYDGEVSLESRHMVQLIKDAEKQLGKNGRILVRKSGTEPLIRIMVEGKSKKEIEKLANNIAEEIRSKSESKYGFITNVWKNISNSRFGFGRWSRNSG
jgi:phosphoglucosamine mutase